MYKRKDGHATERVGWAIELCDEDFGRKDGGLVAIVNRDDLTATQ